MKRQQLISSEFDHLFDSRHRSDADKTSFVEMDREFANALSELSFDPELEAQRVAELERHNLTKIKFWALLDVRKEELIKTVHNGILTQAVIEAEERARAILKVNTMLFQTIKLLHRKRMDIVRGRSIPTDAVFGANPFNL